MPQYSLASLSPFDFEVLCRDLLQAEMGLRLESFASGRDRGIDMRYTGDKSVGIVIQAKHYSGSTWSDLRRALEKEVNNVRALEPSRYIIMTSLGMTPDRKQWVLETFAPYCQSPGDVFGAEDINNLLGRFPEIERKHYKLWLTSVAVLERILHSDVFADQASELRQLRNRISAFVANDSVTRALEILNRKHFCVITGVPGIGKTTLAEMLVMDHIEREYECFRIWDVAGARRVYSEREKQLFYFDDFLGRTALRFTERNEDEQLLRLIRDVTESGRHKLILTTREYILNQARAALEGLARMDVDASRCIVALSDYTPSIRAGILYNHLYYAGVPQTHVEELVRAKSHRRIVRHRNYSPRLIEAMTDILNVRDIPAHEYPGAFTANLDMPTRIWEIAYKGHLSTAAQDALLVLTTLPDHTLIGDAARAFEAFHDRRSMRYAQPRTPYDWSRALKELEGTFAAVGAQHQSLTVEFHNPSIRDFMEGHLRANPQDVADLLASTVFREQVLRLFQIDGEPSGSRAVSYLEAYGKAFGEVAAATELWGSGASLRRTRRGEAVVERFSRVIPLIEKCGVDERALPIVEEMLGGVIEYVEGSDTDREQLVKLRERLGRVSVAIAASPMLGRVRDAVHIAAFAEFDPRTLSTNEYDAMVAFATEHPEEVTTDEMARLSDGFEEFAAHELRAIQSETDLDFRRDWYDQLSDIAERLRCQLALSRDDLLNREELAVEPDEESVMGSGGGDVVAMSDRELDDMFDSLTR